MCIRDRVPNQAFNNAQYNTNYAASAQPLLSGGTLNTQPAYGNAATNQAPVMGLNAGPGALFPIQYNGQNAGAVNGAGANAQFPSQQVPRTSVSPVVPNYGGNAYPNVPQAATSGAGVNSMNMPNSYPGMQPPQVNMQPVYNGGYPQQPATTVSAPQYGAGQNLRTASLPQQPNVQGAGGAGVNPQTNRSPLAAYEQQLQNLDGQYNHCLLYTSPSPRD